MHEANGGDGGNGITQSNGATEASREECFGFAREFVQAPGNTGFRSARHFGRLADVRDTDFTKIGYLLFVQAGNLVAQRFDAVSLAPGGYPARVRWSATLSSPGLTGM